MRKRHQARYSGEGESGVQLTVVYIHHNCFILQGLGETLVFDFPDPSHLNPEQISLARSLVRGSNLCVFASHSHADHFTPAVAGLAALASRARFVLSDDVAQMHPDFEPGESEFEIHFIEPDQEIEVGEMSILGLESTDLGVGFLIRTRGAVIWFGGMSRSGSGTARTRPRKNSPGTIFLTPLIS